MCFVVYGVYGRSDAPPRADERRLPLNGWCRLEEKPLSAVNCLEMTEELQICFLSGQSRALDSMV